MNLPPLKRTLPALAAGCALAVAGASLLSAQGRVRGVPGQDSNAGTNNRPAQTRDVRRPQSGTAVKLKPTGFIQVAADYDGDGVYDAVETIYAVDFVTARDSSRQRMDSVNRRPRAVSGELTNLKQIPLSNRYGGPHMVGRVKTDRGTVAKVDFGPVAQVEPLGLTEGDRVDVEGRRGRINDRAMLLATKITSDGKTETIDRPEPTGLRRVKGEVVGLSNKTFRGQTEASVIGDLRLVSGREVKVVMGAESKLKPLNVKQGDEISLLARPGSINDEPALIATVVYADGKSADVSPTSGKTKTR